MSYPIIHLNDESRKMIAEIYTPEQACKHGDSTVQHKLTESQKSAIAGLLRGALLAYGWTDNRYANPNQGAYAMECAATYIPELQELNTYDCVFCPIMEMLRNLHEQYIAEKEG